VKKAERLRLQEEMKRRAEQRMLQENQNTTININVNTQQRANNRMTGPSKTDVDNQVEGSVIMLPSKLKPSYLSPKAGTAQNRMNIIKSLNANTIASNI
jgi:hypothetical protein